MTFSLILLAHWVGDFALQSTNMALQKSHSLKWLSIHVAVYSSCILVVSAIFLPFEQWPKYVAANAILHFITDFFTSKLASRYRETPRIYFPIIGFDQFLHTLALYWTLKLL